MYKNDTTNSIKAVRMSLVEMTCLVLASDMRRIIDDCRKMGGCEERRMEPFLKDAFFFSLLLSACASNVPSSLSPSLSSPSSFSLSRFLFNLSSPTDFRFS